MKLQELNIDDLMIKSSLTKDDLSNIVKSISSNEIKLNELFLLLEPFLVSTDTQKRLKAVKFIINLITSLEFDYLTDLEASHLSTFIRSKIEDHYTIAPAVLPGLFFLIKSKNLNNDERFNLIKAILRDVHVQSLTQADRGLVYTIFNYILNDDEKLRNLITNYKFDSDFVYGFIQAMDSEKDPRNLILCFKAIPLICKYFTFKPFVEELFEVFSCYYPIDFTPPPDDPAKITKDDLIQLLRNCFASSPLFAKYSIPMLLDKLDSDVDSARLDSLLTYIECSKVYDASDYKEFIEQLWNNFQKLSMSTTSIQIEDASLKAIENLTLSISKSVQIEKTLLSLDFFIEKCIQCCLVYLKDADLKLVWPSAKCLLAISNSNETAFILVAKVLIRFLLDQYSEQSNQINQKKIYLDLLIKFLTNGQKYSKTNACVYIVDSKSEIVNLCFDIFKSSALKHGLEIQALNLVEVLVRYKNVIKSIDCDRLIKQLWDEEIDVSENKNEIVRIVLVIISEFDSLFDHVFDSIEKRVVRIKILNLFAQMNFDSSKLNTKLEIMIRLATTAENDCVQLVDIYKYLIEFNQKYENNEEIKESFNRNLFNYLKFLTNEVKLVDNFDLILKTSYLFQVYSSKLISKADFKAVFEIIYAKITELKSFEISSQTNNIQMLNLLMQFLCSLNNELFKHEIKEFFEKHDNDLLNLSILHQDTGVNLLASQFYASLINKLLDENLINQVLNGKFIETKINEIEMDNNLKSFQLWVWLTKGLLLRNSGLFELFMNKLLDWLDNEKLTLNASQAFFIILNDYENVMRRDRTNAIVKLFYKQRFFNFVIIKLKEKFNSIDNQKLKISYVTALSSTLISLPKNIISQQLSTMLPMLVYSLNNTQGNENLWFCSLKSLDDLISQSSPDARLNEYLKEILDKLFQLSKYKDNMEIRCSALNCILKLANNQDPNILIKYQRDVVKQIEPCLSDKKRLVRQKAVAARNKWYLLTTAE